MQVLETRVRLRKINQLLLCILATLALAKEVGSQNIMATSPITFAGQASGGTLTLAEVMNRDGRFLAIQTSADESSESVAQRLADAITGSDPFKWWGPNVYTIAEKRMRFQGATILGLPGFPNGGQWVLGGTETGLGIPPPPLSVSARYDPATDKVSLNWVSPPGGYDSIALVINGVGSSPYPGESTNCTIPLLIDRDTKDNMDVLVIGYRKDVPSNAGVITVDRSSQQEMTNIPFTLGLAPNWSAWSDQGGLGAVQDSTVITLEQGDRGVPESDSSRSYRYPHRPDEKRFFQAVRTHKSGSNGGIWRKFLGLVPGHTYRLHARIGSLSMEDPQSDGSFSLHAAYNEASGKDLSVEQLSGTAPLPKGDLGPQAGRITGIGPSAETKGEWKQYSTAEDAPGKEISDITLPEGITMITLWLRCSGSMTSGVGLDWVALEDLSCTY